MPKPAKPTARPTPKPAPSAAPKASAEVPAPVLPAPAGDTASVPEAVPAAEGAPAAEAGKKRKGKSKGRGKRPPIPLPDPRDADELLALDLKALDRLNFEAMLRMGHAKRRRTDLLRVEPTDLDALHATNGEIGWLGALQSALTHRRSQLRAEARQSQGQPLERAEAIAVAVDRLVSGPLHARVMREADQILHQSAKDLERDLQAPQPEPPLLKN
jgi:hypothetical protein